MEADTSPLVWGDAGINTSILYCLSKHYSWVSTNFSLFSEHVNSYYPRKQKFFLSWQVSFKIVELNVGEQQKLDFSYLYYSGKFWVMLFFKICYSFYVHLVPNLMWDQKFLVYVVYSIIVANGIILLPLKRLCVSFLAWKACQQW